MHKSVGALSLLVASLALPGVAPAATLGFTCITVPTLSEQCTIGATQLSVDVFAGTGAQTGQVGFTFLNSGPAASAISEIYFDDGTLLAQASIINGPGVNFVQGANPGDLLGGQSISPQFNVTQGFLAEASNPPPENGAGPGEAVTIFYTLQSGQNFTDTLNALGSGSLRIGLHTIGFANGASASFVNTPVPLPAAALLMVSGLLGLGTMRGRRVLAARVAAGA